MNEEDIIARIKQHMPDAVVDAAGEDCSFELYIISEAFTGTGLLQRQKQILALFKQELSSGQLHALSVTAKTPAENQKTSGLLQISI